MNATTGKDDLRNTTQASSVAGADRPIPLRGNRIDSRDLFAGAREIIIAHGEEVYRLRLTAQNKLILTK